MHGLRGNGSGNPVPHRSRVRRELGAEHPITKHAMEPRRICCRRRWSGSRRPQGADRASARSATNRGRPAPVAAPAMRDTRHGQQRRFQRDCAVNRRARPETHPASPRSR
jgi:hypothetical protein